MRRPVLRADRPTLAHRLRVEAHTVWLAIRDPATPWPARALGLLIAAYALSPIDLIPDFIPVLGLLDDLVLIPAGLWLLHRMMPADLLARHRAVAEIASERPRSRLGIAIVLAAWLLSAWVIYWTVRTGWD